MRFGITRSYALKTKNCFSSVLLDSDPGLKNNDSLCHFESVQTMSNRNLVNNFSNLPLKIVINIYSHRGKN